MYSWNYVVNHVLLFNFTTRSSPSDEDENEISEFKLGNVNPLNEVSFRRDKSGRDLKFQKQNI